MGGMLVQAVLNGLVTGLQYAMLAAGVSLIFGTARILFFSHGAIYMLGAMLACSFAVHFGMPYFSSLILIPLGIGLLGVFLERYLFRPIRSWDLATCIISLALAMLITGVAKVTFGEAPVGFQTPFPGVLNLGGVIVTVDRLAIMAFSVAFLSALYLFLQRTKAGRAIRAVADDQEAAALIGVNINRSNMLLFFIVLALGAEAGVLVAPVYSASVTMGDPILMMTLVVVILGGLGSFLGAIVSALFLGLLYSFGYTFLGGITTLVSFVIVIAFLIFRPQGLWGHE
jgi:branched-chain amino acid transport system permease protein